MEEKTVNTTAWHFDYHTLSWALLTDVHLKQCCATPALKCFSLPLKLDQAEMENQEEITFDHFVIWKYKSQMLILKL